MNKETKLKKRSFANKESFIKWLNSGSRHVVDVTTDGTKSRLVILYKEIAWQ